MSTEWKFTPEMVCLRERVNVLLNRYLVFSNNLREAKMSNEWLKDMDTVVLSTILL
jgi:hypothetical protein